MAIEQFIRPQGYKLLLIDLVEKSGKKLRCFWGKITIAPILVSFFWVL
jgi:hypothetical protein